MQWSAMHIVVILHCLENNEKKIVYVQYIFITSNIFDLCLAESVGAKPKDMEGRL